MSRAKRKSSSVVYVNVTREEKTEFETFARRAGLSVRDLFRAASAMIREATPEEVSYFADQARRRST